MVACGGRCLSLKIFVLGYYLGFEKIVVTSFTKKQEKGANIAMASRF